MRISFKMVLPKITGRSTAQKLFILPILALLKVDLIRVFLRDFDF